MGAKQSKRSVDISGKEAEGGGEVAAAGAGGEGRMEQLADADALKPQLNGDAHIQNEQTDKEKELDSGTPENEKDATTEKEGKEEDDKEKEAAPVTNGESEPKVENGDSTPEDGKKPKKEKVKKKWSLRSISFSRKDKPKQEKKQKEEEPKTNGEPEKVPEETAEATPEAVANEVAEEAKATAEEKDEKTPETPVTEPLTNGTSTPESSAPIEESAAAPAPSPPVEPTPEPQPEPDQLPVNGLSLDEPKPDTTEVNKPEETKPEPPVVETAEIVPAPEIPKEVCVERMPLLEPTPPPLPANPPPSSVASFAATTMAPELTDASLANTADAAISPLSALPDTKDVLTQPEPPIAVTVSETLESEIPSILKDSRDDTPALAVDDEAEVKDNVLETLVVNVSEQVDESPKIDIETKETPKVEIEIETSKIETNETETKTVIAEASVPVQDLIPQVEILKSEPIEIEVPEVESVKTEAPVVESTASATLITESVESNRVDNEAEALSQGIIATDSIPAPKVEDISEQDLDILDADDSSLPPPPPPVQDDEDVTNVDVVEESLLQIPEPIVDIKEAILESNNIANTKAIIETNDIANKEAIIKSNDIANEEMTNGVHDMSPEEIVDAEKMKQKMKNAAPQCAAALDSRDATSEALVQSVQPDQLDQADQLGATLQNGGATPVAEPAALHTPQEPLPVSDKLADLIPEVPDVPELKTETLQETVTDVAVAN